MHFLGILIITLVLLAPCSTVWTVGMRIKVKAEFDNNVHWTKKSQKQREDRAFICYHKPLTHTHSIIKVFPNAKDTCVWFSSSLPLTLPSSFHSFPEVHFIEFQTAACHCTISASKEYVCMILKFKLLFFFILFVSHPTVILCLNSRMHHIAQVCSL